MKKLILLLTLLLMAGCSGGSKDSGVSERELYGEKRADCTSTKSTDEGANITQCAHIRPDAKAIEDRSNNLSEDYNPENYGPSKYQNIQK